MNKNNLLGNLKNDIPASIVVFFVAVPLCLGIALASGAPLFSGIIAGIVGGVVVGALSGSNLGVSGPAAGLAAIVLVAIQDLGSYEVFLMAVVLAGIIQVVFGLLRLGIIAHFFPSSVIKGMLTGIGIIIILKQIPNFFGYDEESAWDIEFFELDGGNTFSELLNTVENIQPGSALIGLISLMILILWEAVLSKKHKIFNLIQGPLVAVAGGVIFYLLTKSHDVLSIGEKHLVSVPVPDSVSSFAEQFVMPSLSAIQNPQVWIVAITIAIVASIETLLSVEATDKLDPARNITPSNRELFAQGVGNIVSGGIGGLPVTQVIVRSSANIQSGGKTKMAAILHGLLLLIAVVFLPGVLNLIPLSVLAAVLLVVGYKLAKPSLFASMFNLGWKQFLPFIITILGIIFKDLLVGVGLGLFVGVVVVLIKSFQNSHFLHQSENKEGVKMKLAEEVTFMNKAAILGALDEVPENSSLEIDVRDTRHLDYDVIEILEDFVIKSKNRNIDVTLISEKGTVVNPESYVDFFKLPSRV